MGFQEIIQVLRKINSDPNILAGDRVLEIQFFGL